MQSDYRRGVTDGLKLAAKLCDDTAGTLTQATDECEHEGDAETSQLTAAGVIYVRHIAARIRAAALSQRAWRGERHRQRRRSQS